MGVTTVVASGILTPSQLYRLPIPRLWTLPASCIVDPDRRTSMKPKILAGVAVLALAAAPGNVPKFEFDPNWPKPLPNNWILGAIGGNFVDGTDHIWVANRPGSLDNNDKYAALDPPQADCCVPAPPILEFDAAGNLIQGWGGASRDKSAAYDWPET